MSDEEKQARRRARRQSVVASLAHLEQAKSGWLAETRQLSVLFLKLNGFSVDEGTPEALARYGMTVSEVRGFGRQKVHTEIYRGTDACMSPVLNAEEAAQHPHNKGRGTFAPSASSPGNPKYRTCGKPS